jgi:hypothetical protein
VEAKRDVDRVAIGALRDRLIGHFMGQTGDAVAKARAERGGSLVAAIDFLNREGRLSPLLPMKQTPLGEIIATYHVGDPFGVADSWNLTRRRKILYDELPLLKTRFGPR